MHIVTCCCNPFACGEDIVECGEIVGGGPGFLGNVQFWDPAAPSCDNSFFVHTVELFWDFVLSDFVFVVGLGDTWQVPDHPTNSAGRQWYELAGGRMGEFTRGDGGTLIGCMVRDDAPEPGYHFLRIRMGGLTAYPFIAYWIKATGTDKVGDYTYQPTLSTGWSSWPQGIAPSVLDAGCYVPTPTTITIANC